MNNVLLKRLSRKMKMNRKRYKKMYRKKKRLFIRRGLRTIRPINKNEFKFEKIYHNRLYKRRIRKFKNFIQLPITRAKWWKKQLQERLSNYLTLRNKSKILFVNIKKGLDKSIKSLSNTPRTKEVALEKLSNEIKKNLKRYLKIYSKLNRHKFLYCLKKEEKVRDKKNVRNFSQRLCTRYSSRLFAIKNWKVLLKWDNRFNRRLNKMILYLRYNDTNYLPSSIEVNLKKKYSAFLLHKMKRYKLSTSSRKLKRIRRRYNWEKKKALPVIRRVKPIERLFEQNSNWKRDVSFNSFWFAKLINQFVKRGRKQFAEKTIFNVFKRLKFQFNNDAFVIFWKLLTKIKPIVITVPKRIGKLYHHIPIPVRFSRGYKVGLKWLLKGIKSQGNFALQHRILNEILATLNLYRSFTIKQRDTLYYIATENRTYSHYRWI